MITSSKHHQFTTPHSRLRFLRSLTGLTRSAIELKYNLPEITLKKWETGKLLLSAKAITKCITIYRNEGITVTENWLLTGTGIPPNLYPNDYVQSFSYGKDIDYFKQQYPNCIICSISSEEMLPKYKPKDIVIGFITEREIAIYHNLDCIIQMKNGDILLRKLLIAENSKPYLMCTNPLPNQNAILTDASIDIVTPVRWHQIYYDFD